MTSKQIQQHAHEQPKTLIALKLLLNANENTFRSGKQAIEHFQRQGNDMKSTAVSFRKALKDTPTLKILIKQINKHFNHKVRKAVPVDIIGGGPACNCHGNSRLATEFLNSISKGEYSMVKGYNICASYDLQLVQIELHSCVKHLPTGRILDFTTDYNDEKVKWFIECDKHKEYEIVMRQMGIGRLFDLAVNKEEHLCKASGLFFSSKDNRMGTIKEMLKKWEFVDKGIMEVKMEDPDDWEENQKKGIKMELMPKQIEIFNKYGGGIDKSKYVIDKVNTITYQESIKRDVDETFGNEMVISLIEQKCG